MASLVNYSESSEEDSDGGVIPIDFLKPTTDTNNQTVVHKRGLDDSFSNDEGRKKIRSQMPELQMPKEILEMFGQAPSSRNRSQSEAEAHGGRIRSFAHVEGNWSTFAHVPYEMDDHVLRLRHELFLLLRPWGEFQPMDDHHVSLSRTVVIRHHWIDPLKESIRSGIASYQIDKCLCQLSGVTIYTNDEKTRSFLALDVTCAADTLKMLTKVMDDAFADFRLPAYYKNPSYHLSIGWVLGDITGDLPTDTTTKLQIALDKHLEENPDLRQICVDEVRLKTGNKIFSFPL